MKVKKLKFEQYRVRGKHREFDVLVFPQKKNMWAYYESFDERYEIDGDLVAFQQVKYALATLITAPIKSFISQFAEEKSTAIISTIMTLF